MSVARFFAFLLPRLTLAAAVCALPACAARPHWSKDGVDPAQIEADWQECRRRAEGMDAYQISTSRDYETSGPPSVRQKEEGGRARSAVASCMHGKGYDSTR